MSFFEYLIALRGDLLVKLGQHVVLTGVSALSAVAIGVPLGILISRYRFLRGGIMGFAGIMQTIPSVAMLALLMIPLGLGARPAIAALIPSCEGSTTRWTRISASPPMSPVHFWWSADGSNPGTNL